MADQVPEVQAPPRPPQHDKYPWPEKSRLLGTRVSRIDGPLKASGRAKYSYDIVRPGMLYGRILRSSHAHARLKSIDASAAEKAPGVKALLITIKPGDKVLFPGEEIGALAAITEQQAADALRMIKVEWEVLPALANVEQAMRPEAPQVFTPANTRKGTAQEDGDLAAGFKSAAEVLHQRRMFEIGIDLFDRAADVLGRQIERITDGGGDPADAKLWIQEDDADVGRAEQVVHVVDGLEQLPFQCGDVVAKFSLPDSGVIQGHPGLLARHRQFQTRHSQRRLRT